ncbi:MAG: cell envelope integrity protein TolA [Desulfomonile tiedjei]|nr:cell envelope integrity protein TolA [Desulfomonile tiedjei]
MIRVLSKSSYGASPRMLLFSAGLHAILLCAIILASFSMVRRPAPSEEVISRINLVDAAPGPAVVEQVEHGPIKAPAVLPREEPEPMAKEAPESVRQVVEHAAMTPSQNDAIPLRKRRKPAEQVEKPKKPEPKKPDATASNKKEDPQKYLENRLTALRDKLKDRKTAASPSPAVANDGQNPGRSGSNDGGNAAEENLRRWLEEVRNRINSRWSVFGDLRQVRRLTEVRVKVDDDGHLMDASVAASSGSQVFDQSALRAVFQADPFPAIPPDVSEKIRKAGGLALRFAPGGMQ